MDSIKIDGVLVRDLRQHHDQRGTLREMYRSEWVPIDPFLQWNIVTSLAGSLRGVHVHPRHSDYLHVIDGEMHLGLHDLRPKRRAERQSAFFNLSGENPMAIYIPPGVCHGFWFPQKTTYVYGLSTGWTMGEELGCRFDDPQLGLDWPTKHPTLSERDAAPEMTYFEMREAWLEHPNRAVSK